MLKIFCNQEHPAAFTLMSAEYVFWAKLDNKGINVGVATNSIQLCRNLHFYTLRVLLSLKKSSFYSLS